MDDITPDMDWDKFLSFKSLLDEHGIKPLIGVVPDNRDKKLSLNPARDDFWKYIKQLQKDGWTVAMHGLNHLYTTGAAGLFPIGGKSEFAGLSPKKQEKMIAEGKRLLKDRGISTDIFMAPSHSFDKSTLKALKDNGFTTITDGFGISPFRSRDMVYYPISISRSSSLKDSREGLVTFVYHANTMDEKDFKSLRDLLETGKVVSYSEYDKLPVKARTVFGDIREYCIARAKYLAVRAGAFVPKNIFKKAK